MKATQPPPNAARPLDVYQKDHRERWEDSWKQHYTETWNAAVSPEERALIERRRASMQRVFSSKRYQAEDADFKRELERQCNDATRVAKDAYALLWGSPDCRALGSRAWCVAWTRPKELY